MRIIQIKNIAASFWSYYDDTLPANIMVIGETACDENYYISRTSSRIMAIEYILSGSGTLQMEGETFHPKRNTAILLPKHSCHTYYSASDDFWVKKWIVFDGMLMQTLIDTYLPKNVCCFENCNLLPYFQEIEKIIQTDADSYKQMTDALVVVLFRMILKMKNSYQNSDNAIYRKIKSAVDAQIEGELSLTALSHEFGYSKNHIITLFKSAYGITPYRYFAERKIDIAKLYLINTGLSVEAIAQKLNYADRSYFADCFKRHTGKTPTEYRRENS